MRDPFGFRPLVMGRRSNGAIVVASETCALDLIEAIYEREVYPESPVDCDVVKAQLVGVGSGVAEPVISGNNFVENEFWEGRKTKKFGIRVQVSDLRSERPASVELR
ncbi:hypothetical protein L6164_028663 [Bauhinia variegata]|uniref:Uncharacterized protein n=1 Tax=Bauhinia variegata TaxID=167791 RepID=A0ACB9L6F0_BAUVA|nr:hypothetical protein L6164_028663 [Bauhinia variegata]